MNNKSATYLKKFLLDIYRCQNPFELLVIDKMPKTRIGVYIVDKQRIRIYAKWEAFFHWNKLQFTNMLIISMKQRNEGTRAGERNVPMVLNSGEFIPP